MTRRHGRLWLAPLRPAVTIAAVAIATVLVAACGDVRLLATETPAATVVPRAAPQPASTATSRVFAEPRCREYDDYQGSAMAFYSLSAIVQDGLDSAPSGTAGETLDSAVARFEDTIRRALAGEVVTPVDPIEELALLWVATDGCMR